MNLNLEKYTFDDLVKDIELEKKYTDQESLGKFGSGVVLSIFTLGLLTPQGEDLKDITRRKTHPMSDLWLKKVALTEDLSEAGIKFLGRILRKEKQVTVHRALQWAEVERKEKTKVINLQLKIQHKLQDLKEEKLRVNRLNQEGGQLLMQRIEAQKLNIHKINQKINETISDLKNLF